MVEENCIITILHSLACIGWDFFLGILLFLLYLKNTPVSHSIAEVYIHVTVLPKMPLKVQYHQQVSIPFDACS